MPKMIPLSKGLSAIVDDEDHEELSRHIWFAKLNGRKTPVHYAVRNTPGQYGGGQVAMHVHLMKPPKGFHVDHKNGDTLDYQRANLRVCTEQQNQLNKGGRGGASRFKGVWWRKDTERWVAEIRANKTRHNLGCFDVEEDAARAYDTAAVRLHGEFARLNFPVDPAQPSAQLEGPGYVRRKAQG